MWIISRLSFVVKVVALFYECIAMSEIAAMITSIKSLTDILKAMKGLYDGKLIQEKVIELQSVILDVQEKALIANMTHSELTQAKSKLEKEVAKLKAWGAEKKKYKLQEWEGILAYIWQPLMQSTEIFHAICTNCYTNDQKSILQMEQRMAVKVIKCYKCHAEHTILPQF